MLTYSLGLSCIRLLIIDLWTLSRESISSLIRDNSWQKSWGQGSTTRELSVYIPTAVEITFRWKRMNSPFLRLINDVSIFLKDFQSFSKDIFVNFIIVWKSFDKIQNSLFIRAFWKAYRISDIARKMLSTDIVVTSSEILLAIM